MTAGNGVAHAEEANDFRGEFQGVQLWVAQPEATRHGAAAFEHHDVLPQVELEHGTATVLQSRPESRGDRSRATISSASSADASGP